MLWMIFNSFSSRSETEAEALTFILILLFLVRAARISRLFS